jgi:hypothetical protein
MPTNVTPSKALAIVIHIDAFTTDFHFMLRDKNLITLSDAFERKTRCRTRDPWYDKEQPSSSDNSPLDMGAWLESFNANFTTNFNTFAARMELQDTELKQVGVNTKIDQHSERLISLFSDYDSLKDHVQNLSNKIIKMERAHHSNLPLRSFPPPQLKSFVPQEKGKNIENPLNPFGSNNFVASSS